MHQSKTECYLPVVPSYSLCLFVCLYLCLCRPVRISIICLQVSLADRPFARSYGKQFVPLSESLFTSQAFIPISSSAYFSVCWSVCFLFACTDRQTSVCFSANLLACLLSVYQSVCMSVCPFDCPSLVPSSARPSVSQSVCLSVCLSNCLSVCLTVCLSAYQTDVSSLSVVHYRRVDVNLSKFSFLVKRQTKIDEYVAIEEEDSGNHTENPDLIIQAKQ